MRKLLCPVVLSLLLSLPIGIASACPPELQITNSKGVQCVQASYVDQCAKQMRSYVGNMTAALEACSDGGATPVEDCVGIASSTVAQLVPEAQECANLNWLNNQIVANMPRGS